MFTFHSHGQGNYDKVYFTPANYIEREIIGDTMRFDKAGKPIIKKGLASDTAILFQSIDRLKREERILSRQSTTRDSLLLTINYRIAYASNIARNIDSSRASEEQIRYYENRALALARKMHAPGNITTKLYQRVIARTNRNDEKIRLLKQWKSDYTRWLHKDSLNAQSNNPGMMLAAVYRQAGATNDMIREYQLILSSNSTKNDKMLALEGLISHYSGLEQPETYVPLSYEYIKLQSTPVENLSEAIGLSGVYSRLTQHYIEQNKLDSASLMIDKIMPSVHCPKCSEPPLYPNLVSFYKAWLAALQGDNELAKAYFAKTNLNSISAILTLKMVSTYTAAVEDKQTAFIYLTTFAPKVDQQYKRTMRGIRGSSEAFMELATAYQSSLLEEKAAAEKRIMQQEFQTVQNENALKLENAQIANKLLETEASNAEKQKTAEIKLLESKARTAALEKEYKINLLNKSVESGRNLRNAMIIGLSILSAFMIWIIYQYQYRRKLSQMLQMQNQEITGQHKRLEQTLVNLKATQAQLIQSEKMASLGELTAGIAHEIQNPLNFVNNFSEINTELSAEILEAAEKGDLEEVKVIAAVIRNNQEKIAEHGKRADSIVKSMLQHSRSSAGAKEPTDISALADEYLRLSYHGMRAKDKSFNATLKTEFDPHLPLLPVVSQDISRVLLNLFNNAFYAVHEKSKTAGREYEPTVTVRTKLSPAGNGNPSSAIISVSDNGPGISDSIKEKIFQPFFTTKPTGQGTGLGLSLSYDIITKAHGGNIHVSTQEGNGSTFMIQLPTN
jgi:signal transduction histidine kinase